MAGVDWQPYLTCAQGQLPGVGMHWACISLQGNNNAHAQYEHARHMLHNSSCILHAWSCMGVSSGLEGLEVVGRRPLASRCCPKEGLSSCQMLRRSMLA